MKSLISITHEPILVHGDDERSEIASNVEDELASIFEDIDQIGPLDIDGITFKLGAAHTDWEEGQPCPECGCTEISVMQASEDIYQSNDGSFEFVQKGEALGKAHSYMCKDCFAFLRSHSTV